MMVGTHNVTHSAEEVVKGITTIVETVKKKQPHASVIVMVSPILRSNLMSPPMSF